MQPVFAIFNYLFVLLQLKLPQLPCSSLTISPHPPTPAPQLRKFNQKVPIGEIWGRIAMQCYAIVQKKSEKADEPLRPAPHTNYNSLLFFYNKINVFIKKSLYTILYLYIKQCIFQPRREYLKYRGKLNMSTLYIYIVYMYLYISYMYIVLLFFFCQAILCFEPMMCDGYFFRIQFEYFKSCFQIKHAWHSTGIKREMAYPKTKHNNICMYRLQGTRIRTCTYILYIHTRVRKRINKIEVCMLYLS